MPKPKTVDVDSLLDTGNEFPAGRDIRSLGPSDSSDTGADMVGVGGGLDQAEEAQLGITDEEIDEAVRDSLGLDRK